MFSILKSIFSRPPSAPISLFSIPVRHQSSRTSPTDNMLASPGLMKRVLHIRRTTRLSRAGKVRSLYALVLVGNGKGAAGYGEGKASDIGGAIEKATRRAIRNLMPIARYDGRTIYNDIEHKFVKTNLTLRSAPPGYGIVANNNIHEICRAAGIQDLSAKVRGSTNPMNVVKATCTYKVCSLLIAQSRHCRCRERQRKWH